MENGDDYNIGDNRYSKGDGGDDVIVSGTGNDINTGDNDAGYDVFGFSGNGGNDIIKSGEGGDYNTGDNSFGGGDGGDDIIDSEEGVITI